MAMKTTILLQSVLIAALSVAGEMKTPETSSLFQRYVDPDSEVVSYILKPGLVADNQQSLYFTAKSLTDDGRFLVFSTSANEFVKVNGKPPSKRKSKAVVDFLKDEAIRLDDMEGSTPFIDVKTDQMWYVARKPDRICRRDLLVDPKKEIEVCRLPVETILAKGESVSYWCTHITLTQDRGKAFLDIGIRCPDKSMRYVEGTVDLATGKWDEWCRAPFYCNHGQLNPKNDNLAMCAWECCWRSEEAMRWKEISQVYPRIWLFRKGQRPELIVPELKNGATHEIWDEDGKGFYWCCGGVYHCDLETRKQEHICPLFASHATKSANNRYVTFDCPIGPWYRGCSWKVGFWNRDTQRGIYLHSKRPPLCPKDDGWHHHPDPHPQFVCQDRYIICTINNADGHMDLSVTPVAQLIAGTAVDAPHAVDATKVKGR